VNVARGRAALSHFASQVSMSSDLLDVSDEYVAESDGGRGTGWGFDTPVDGLSVMRCDKYHGRVAESRIGLTNGKYDD
jgi:hypothetical protein